MRLVTEPWLLPLPKRVRREEGSFSLRSGIPIVLSRSNDDDIRSAEALRDRVLRKTGRRLAIECHAKSSDLGPRIELRRRGDYGQGYRLRVGPKVATVTGLGAAGLRYGAETLAQLVVPGRKSIPAISIDDRPALAERGLLIDISRGKVPTKETLEGIMDLMVQLKLNLLMLYTEHTFKFRRHPAIGRGASPLSAADLLELDAYAAARHIDLVPTLQSLGHMHQHLKIRRYRPLAESEKKWSISPAVAGSYKHLEDLYSEYLPNFRSEWFNANCDEPVDLGLGRSKKWAEREGRGTVFRTHLERVEALAARFGKKTMFWGDVVHEHPEQIKLLSREAILLDWWYEADHDFERVRVFSKHGIPFMVTCGTSSWNTLFPRGDNAVANITGHAEAGKRFGARGIINTDWGDNGHFNMLGNSLFGFAWGAQAGWGRSDIDERSFERAFSLQLFGDRRGVVGRLYRLLGRLHDTGFEHFNNSPLKSVYFDDAVEAKFLSRVDARVLERTRKGLLSVQELFASHAERFEARPLAKAELELAIDASILAADKGLGRQQARRLARRQTKLLARHHELWLARNRPSNFEATRALYLRSIESLNGR